MTIGRTPILNEELQEALCDGLRAGNYLETVCDYVGVSKSSVYAWLERGEQEPDSIYGRFLEAVQKASAEAELASVATVRVGDKGWQAHMTFLERRYPKRWARRDPVMAEMLAEAKEFKERVDKFKQMTLEEKEAELKKLTAAVKESE